MMKMSRDEVCSRLKPAMQTARGGPEASMGNASKTRDRGPKVVLAGQAQLPDTSGHTIQMLPDRK